MFIFWVIIPLKKTMLSMSIEVESKWNVAVRSHKMKLHNFDRSDWCLSELLTELTVSPIILANRDVFTHIIMHIENIIRLALF